MNLNIGNVIMRNSICLLVFIMTISNSFTQELTSGIPVINTIKKITVEGIKTVKEDIILSKMESKVGEIFSNEKIKRDINNIYSLELFSDIEIYKEEAIDGVELKVKVKERPIIKSIKYVGNKEYSANDIESETNFKKDIPFNYIKLKRAIEKIISFYKEKGFYLVSVTYEIKEEKDNTVEITFNIKEGKKMYVHKIIINGTKAFTDKVIKSKMETSEAGFLVAGTFKEDAFENDLKKIINFYNSEGFINAKISSYSIKYDEEKEKIFINIDIDEGEQFKLGEIKINIDKTFSSKEEKEKEEASLRDIITLKEGDIFNEEVYRRDIEKIKFKYSEKGYIGISISEDRNIDKEKKTVSLYLQIKEGKVFYINKIKIEGNYKTKDYVIKRELLVKEGEPFDGMKIRRSSERIYNLGFFEDVNIELSPGKDPESRDLIFVVKERPTGQLNLGAGYSTLDGLTGFLQLTENNLFGEGRRIGAKWEFGARKQNYELSFLEPYFLGEPVSLGISIYKLLRAYYSDYKDERTGGNIRVGVPAGENSKFWFTYKYEEVNIFDVADTASSTIKSVAGKNTTSSLTAQWIEDTRDSIFFNTKRGYRYSASLEYAGGILLGNNNFTKYIVDGSWYFKTFWEFVLAIHIGAGYVTGFGSTPLVPFYEKFFVGGTDTVRGYNERVLSPQDENKTPIGGDFMVYSNIEYRFPIYGPLMGTLFFDLGRAWNNPLEAKIDNIPTSVGFGIRIMLGGALLIRFDYGYGFDKSLYTPGGQIHFNIGNIF